jgi:hypothetical protein
VVLPPQRRRRPPPYTGKVLMEKADSWHHGVSPSSHQARLDSLLTTLKSLADTGLGAASVLANLHHRRIAPLMERELRIHEMSEAANPTSLARSWFLPKCLPWEYAAMRARHAISLKAGRHDNDDLWSFIMLPDAPSVSRPSFLSRSLATYQHGFDSRFLVEGDRGRLEVRPAYALSPSGCPRCAATGAGARDTEEGEENPAVGAPGAAGQGVPTARAVGTLSPGDFGELVIGRGGRRER